MDDTKRFQIEDPLFPHMGSGEVAVFSEDECISLRIENSFHDEAAAIDMHDPEQIRQLAARLIAEGKKLQDRLDIQEKIGGDQ